MSRSIAELIERCTRESRFADRLEHGDLKDEWQRLTRSFPVPPSTEPSASLPSEHAFQRLLRWMRSPVLVSDGNMETAPISDSISRFYRQESSSNAMRTLSAFKFAYATDYPLLIAAAAEELATRMRADIHR